MGCLNAQSMALLTGREAEYLEEHCTNAVEWIACMLALQISYDGHEKMTVNLSNSSLSAWSF